jgi:hypothetical protein
VKIIIEEGDLGGLPPGVYEASEAGSYFDCLGDEAKNLNLNIDVDMLQKPKPVSPGGRYDFEFNKHELLDPDVTVLNAVLRDRVDRKLDYLAQVKIPNYLFIGQPLDQSREMMQHKIREAVALIADHITDKALKVLGFDGNPFQVACKGKQPTPAWVDLQVGSKRVRLTVGDVIEAPSGMAWTVTGFPTPTTWSCTSSSGHNYNNLALSNLVYDLEKGNKVIQTATATEPCNKTLTDCRRHGNHQRFGGYKSPATGMEMPCPHTFGGSMCGAHPQPKPLHNETPYYTPGTDPIGYDPHGQPIYEGDLVTAPSMSDDPFIKALKQCEEEHTKDCDECYGTGRFKGFGGPCSQGCPIKDN